MPGVIKTAGNNVDLRALFQQQLRGIDVAVHARIDERIVDDALTILRPRIDTIRQRLSFPRRLIRVSNRVEITPRPVNLAGLWLQASIGIEITLR